MCEKSIDNRVLYPDILRIIAIFAVITIHVCSSAFFSKPVLSFDWMVLNFYGSLVRWAVPIFVMVSGMFFLNPQKDLRLSKLYGKNIFRIVVALLFWGVLYQSINVFKVLFLSSSDINLIIKTMIEEYSHVLLYPPCFHLWFLYMIVGLYVLTPLFRIFAKNAEKKDYRYLFFVYALFGICLPFINDLLSVFVDGLKVNFEIVELLGYSTYFILGYYLSKFDVSNKIRRIVYLLAVLSVFFQFIATFLISDYLEKGCEFFYREFRPNVFVQTVAVFLFVKEKTKIEISDRIKTTIRVMANYSFGIYLVHIFFNIFFSKIGFSATSFSPILAVPLRVLMTYLLSFITVLVLDKIPIIRKYCI